MCACWSVREARTSCRRVKNSVKNVCVLVSEGSEDVLSTSEEFSEGCVRVGQ